MLELVIPITSEGWDEAKQEFIEPETAVLELEHSLVSLSKWESKWCKPFITKAEKTSEEILDYIKCMTLNPNVDPHVYDFLTMAHIRQINDYIDAPMTATTFSIDKNTRPNREIVTAEIIYHWMIALQIPSEYERWHLNKLFTLIRVTNIKNSPSKKMSRREAASQTAALNAARRAQLNTKG